MNTGSLNKNSQGLSNMKAFVEARRVKMDDMEITESNFKEKVIEKSKELPVVVDFWASWCMPCLILGPTLEKIAEDYEGKIVLAKVNVDDNQSLSQQFKVMGIPAVKMFKQGKIVDEFTGAIPEPEIKKWIEKNL